MIDDDGNEHGDKPGFEDCDMLVDEVFTTKITKSTKKICQSQHHPWLVFPFVIFVVSISEFRIILLSFEVFVIFVVRTKARQDRQGRIIQHPTSNIRLATGGEIPDAPVTCR
jgi:hypothetical protein